MRKGVTFEAGGQAYTLRYGINALCQIEAQTGEAIGVAARRLAGDAAGGVRMSDLLMFWSVGLAEGGVTPAGAADLMEDIGIMRAGQLIEEAITLAFPPVEKKSEAGRGNGAGQTATA